jgi:drug/metabolite transporter (DMT)-like permease
MKYTTCSGRQIRKERNNTAKYVLLEFAAVAFLAAGGIFIKLSVLPPVTTGFYRVLFSLPLLFPLSYRHLNQVNKEDVILLLFAGIFLAGDISLWNLSFRYTSVAHANLFANLTPLTVIPVSFFIFKERIPRFFIIGTAITLAGVFIIIAAKGSVVISCINTGDVLAFGASFFYASFILITYRLRDRIESSAIMFISGVGCSAALFIISCFFEGFRVPRGFNELWPLFALALCMQVIGHNLLAYCQGKVSVNLSSVICLSQPAAASVYSYFIFSEILTGREIIGIIVVIAGICTVQYTIKK